MEKKKRVAWNKGKKRTEEEKEKQKQTVFKKYGVYNVSQIKEVREKIHISHSSEEWKEKCKKIKLERYGNPNYNNIDKNLKTKELKYGDSHYNNSEKNTETKRKNKTFNTSSCEIDFYNYLSQKYTEGDIIKQYKDVRYPFACDFYIKSKDMFIELNIHPCHHFKPYNKEEDKEELQRLQEKAKTSNYYKNVIKVWTISDVKKREYAQKNNLNYLTIYTIKELQNTIKNNLI